MHLPPAATIILPLVSGCAIMQPMQVVLCSRLIYRVLGLLGVLIGLWSALALSPTPALAQSTRGPLYTVTLDGTVTAASMAYVRRALQVAEASNASALLIVVRSNGGVLRDVRPFAAELFNARVPVVVYIASGTSSGAVGALLLSGAHIAALAPGSSFGSAYPLVQVETALTEQTQQMVLDSVVDQLREWNTARGRNTDWVDQAVREGIILDSAQATLPQPPMIDLVAADVQQLLILLDGRQITLADASQVQLSTLGRTPLALEPNLLEVLWMTLADPTVAFALLILGAVAIYLELASPGVGVFAAVGIGLLAAAGLGLLALPVQWWALALLIVGLLAIGGEFQVQTHGILTGIGLVLLGIGALNMIDPVQAPGASVALWVVVLFGFGVVAAVVLSAFLVIRSRTRPVAVGQEALVGQLAEVRQPLNPRGMVFVDGALWQAISQDGPIEQGDWVRIVSVHHLQLIVRPLDAEESQSAT